MVVTRLRYVAEYRLVLSPVDAVYSLVISFEMPRLPAMASRFARSLKMPRSSLTNALQLTEVMAWNNFG